MKKGVQIPCKKGFKYHVTRGSNTKNGFYEPYMQKAPDTLKTVRGR